MVVLGAAVAACGYYLSNTSARADSIRQDLDAYRQANEGRMVGVERDVKYIREGIDELKKATVQTKVKR